MRATLLALMAVAGIAMLSGWHAASFHDDAHPARTVSAAGTDGGHAASIHDAHDENETSKGDSHSAVHIAAHAIGQGFGMPNAMAAPLPPVAVQRTWLAAAPPLDAGFEPSDLLRPPQA